MLVALLICSDPDCAEQHEGYGSLEELDGLVCEHCECTLQAIGWVEIAA